MFYRYIVTRNTGKTEERNSCTAAMPLVDYHSIIACGYDPYDPFAEFSVEVELISDKALEYGLPLSQIVYDIDYIDKMYKARFKKTVDIKEESA